MEVSLGTLCFIILAAALGSQAGVIPDTNTRELPDYLFDPSTYQGGFYPGDCCFTYSLGRIPCTVVEDSFLDQYSCRSPGVILPTKTGKYICANPKDVRVKNCMTVLKLNDNNYN